jgi:hypothetical protein
VAPKARFRPADSRKRRALAVIGWDCRSETAARVLCEKIAALDHKLVILQRRSAATSTDGRHMDVTNRFQAPSTVIPSRVLTVGGRRSMVATAPGRPLAVDRARFSAPGSWRILGSSSSTGDRSGVWTAAQAIHRKGVTAPNRLPIAIGKPIETVRKRRYRCAIRSSAAGRQSVAPWGAALRSADAMLEGH